MSDVAPRATGSCLCGAVQFSIHGELREVIFCHCVICRRALTHYAAFTACAPDALVLQKSTRLKWYRTSPEARRGFCGRCGAQLFWEPAHGRHISISAGSLDPPARLRPGPHIHCDQDPDHAAVV